MYQKTYKDLKNKQALRNKRYCDNALDEYGKPTASISAIPILIIVCYIICAVAYVIQ